MPGDGFGIGLFPGTVHSLEVPVEGAVLHGYAVFVGVEVLGAPVGGQCASTETSDAWGAGSTAHTDWDGRKRKR